MQAPSVMHSSTLVVEALEYGHQLARQWFWQLWSHPDNLTLLVCNDPLVATLTGESSYKKLYSEEAAVIPVFEGLLEVAKDESGRPLSLMVMPGEWAPWSEAEWKPYYELLSSLLDTCERKKIPLSTLVDSLSPYTLEYLAKQSDAKKIVNTLCQLSQWCSAFTNESVLPTIQLELHTPLLARNKSTGKDAWLPSVVSDSLFIPF